MKPVQPDNNGFGDKNAMMGVNGSPFEGGLNEMMAMGENDGRHT